MVTDRIWFEVVNRHQEIFELLLHGADSVDLVLNKFGQIPLPPYIKHTPSAIDEQAYQTVYAEHPGAVAAPTAGFHFDQELFQNLTNKGINTAFITLHVGLGTFQPVRAANIAEHQMHHEYIEVPEATCEKITTARKNGGKIITVGTTTVRALETASRSGTIKPYHGDTNIFIYPGYHFQSTDILITNFHLPKTSLLMLVSAFAGHENMMRAYEAAIKYRYRFYSYGDAMLIL